jgi:hypothetical protein
VASRQVIVRPDAEQTIAELAGPQVRVAGAALVEAIVQQVPVQSGTSQRLFRSGLRAEPQEDGSVAVTGFPPHWHWFEYGTRWNPAYRPIENAAKALGFNYQGRSG